MIWHSCELTDVLKEFNVSPNGGLTNGTADINIRKYGRNAIRNIEKPSFKKHFFKQLKAKSAIILSVIAAVTLIFNIVYKEDNPYSPIFIVGIILLNSLISAFQLYKSEMALNSLKSVSTPNATVIRDEIEKVISAEELVPGDIILIKSGDIIPADARLIENNNLSCNEYVLTGEDVPVNKHFDSVAEDIAPIQDRTNMLFSGCTVLTGNAKAVVVETGLNTEIGKNSALSQQSGEDNTPLQSRLDATEKLFNFCVLIVCGIVFIINLIQNFKNVGFAATTATALLNSMALAVAAIPEGLPAISTIAIALGIERIIHEDIIIKKVSALETIGQTGVICSDKTGIITKNSMQVEEIFNGKSTVNLNNDQLDEKELMILRLAAVCSTLEDDPTESAIKNACNEKCSINFEELTTIYPRVGLIPFDSARKIMTSINVINGNPVAIIKGAPEILADKFIGIDSKIILDENEKMANNAFRVICVGIKPLSEIPANPSPETIENDINFVGLIGINDPPRTSTIEAINACDKAGIKTVMITGDNLLTAKAVARRVGILKDGTATITGPELLDISDDELVKTIKNYTVFARITPDDKIRIINALQKSGEIVTITGNDFKDAQALANADVGCAIGKYGADVARGNADIIINNSKFESIVSAIRESRGLFANIQKAVAYLLSCNIAELAIYLITLIFWKNPPISAVQLLWINLLTDCAPVLALSTLKADKDVMSEPPMALSGRIFDNLSLFDIILQSAFIAFTSIVAFILGFVNSGNLVKGMTMVFACLGLTEIFHAYNHKNRTSLFLNKFCLGDFINISSILMIFIILFLVLTPAGFAFGLTILKSKDILICLGLSIAIIPFCEILKLLKRLIKNK